MMGFSVLRLGLLKLDADCTLHHCPPGRRRRYRMSAPGHRCRTALREPEYLSRKLMVGPLPVRRQVLSSYFPAQKRVFGKQLWPSGTMQADVKARRPPRRAHKILILGDFTVSLFAISPS